MSEKRVLLVDDDDGIRQIVREILLWAGYGVALAAGKAEALREIGRHSPDLIILDLVLDGESGWEVLRLLRRSHQMPVLLSTGGSVDEEVRADARALGAQGVLEKPFSRDQLLRAIEDLL